MGFGGGAARWRPDARSITATGLPAQVVFGGYHRRMRVLPVLLGALLVVSGIVWVAQGLNLPFAPGSFMTNDRAWVLIGAVTTVAGIVLIGWSRQRGPA